MIGALTIFGPWLTIDYYDHYGPIFETYNGFSLFNSGYYFGIAMFVPIVVSILFIVSYNKFNKNGDKGCGNYCLIMFIATYLLTWFYNIHVMDTYDNYPYYTEVYDYGWAETVAIAISFLNMIFGYLADKRPSQSEPAAVTEVCDTYGNENSVAITYCPNCGADLSSITEGTTTYCPNCGMHIGNGKGGE